MKQFFTGVMLGFLLPGNIIAADGSGKFSRHKFRRRLNFP